jgi:hypothetical protein
MIRLLLLNCSEYHWEVHMQISKNHQKTSLFDFSAQKSGDLVAAVPMPAKGRTEFFRGK